MIPLWIGFIKRTRQPCLALTTLLAVSSLAAADHVNFDVGQLSSCRVVSSANETEEMNIEAAFDVSTLIRFGQTDQVNELLFVVESPARTLHVVDFSPTTELASEFAGNIQRSSSRDHARNAGLNASLSPHSTATAKGTLANSSTTKDSLHYETLAPKQLLVASGTAARGTAVYFKFAATPQTTLDGSRELRVTFRVQSQWRADYVYIRCVAFGSADDNHVPPRMLGSSDFLVPLYLEGDAAAREAANQLGNQELQLRRVASRLRRSAPKKSLSDKLFSLIGHDDNQTAWPHDWLHTVLTSAPHQEDFDFQDRLPASARIATRSFTSARKHLHQLRENDSSTTPLNAVVYEETRAALDLSDN